MKLEQQVCSLYLAKRLKEFGVEQESYFLWVARRYQRPVTGVNPHIGIIHAADINRAPGDNPVYDEILASAFTVAELGEMLPWNYATLKHIAGDYVGIQTQIGSSPKFIGDIRVETEADARAKMLIYLVDNGLVGL